MQDQGNRSPTADEDHAERLVLGALVRSGGEPLSVDEAARVLVEHSEIAVLVLDALYRAGLVHRCGDLAFPTRAARRFAELHTDV
jgi:hypothetical protein